MSHHTSSRPIPTRRGNPCQICSDVSGKCRELDELLLCMNATDAHNTPSGFKFLGLTKDSLWGKFVVYKGFELSQEERDRRYQERQAAKRAEREARSATALSLSERDKATRLLHKYLGLSTRHRQNLRDRGLSDAQIDAGYFFSVAPGDTLPFGVPANYPGAKNRKLSIARPGFVCPAWSIRGEIIGWQLRLDDAIHSKYRWASGDASSHLPNGELPITVIQPPQLKHQWLADVEGLLKPYVAAQRLGAVCIGAAGGNILGSPEQFKQAIASLGVTEIRDFPDAGDVSNGAVMRRRIEKYKFYRLLGLEVRVAWWRQVTKGVHADIDELPNLDVIEYISVEQFLQISKWHGGLDAVSNQICPEVPPQQEPNPELYQWYLKQEAELEEWEENCDRHVELQQEQSFQSFFSNRLEKLKKFLANKPKGFENAKQDNQKKVSENDTCSSEIGESGNNSKRKRAIRCGNVRGDIKRLARALALRCSPKFHARVSRSFWSSDKRWSDNKNDVIEFEPGEHLATIEALAQQATAENKKMIVLDRSEGGTGKSHVVGDFTVGGLAVDKIYYATPRWRNPTVATIEANYAPNTVRNNGLVDDDTKKTPLGNPERRWPRWGENPNVSGNCGKTNEFHSFTEKGYHAETLQSGKNNSICRLSCSKYKSCAGIGDFPRIEGYTFLQDRRNTLAENDKLRLSLDSLPDIARQQKGDEDDPSTAQRVAIVVDEFVQFKSHDKTQADLLDFDNSWMYLQSQIHKSGSLVTELTAEKNRIDEEIDQKAGAIALLESKIANIKKQPFQQSIFSDNSTGVDPNTKTIEELEEQILDLEVEIEELVEKQVEIINQILETQQLVAGLPEALATLEPIIFELRRILAGQKDITSESRYGWTEAMIRGGLGDLQWDEVGQALEVVRKFTPRLENLLKEADSVTLDGMAVQDRKGSADSLRNARRAMREQADRENQDAIASLPSNCIVPVLDILLGKQAGSFRIAFGSVTIYTKNHRHRDLLKQADFCLILDGTETKESLAKKLECDPNEIVVIRQKPKSYKNLKITQIRGLGLLNANRSKTAQRRLDALTAKLKEQYGADGLGILDHKEALDPGEESQTGYWFNDNRGSNGFQDKKALLTAGTPYENIGHLQLLYTTVTGDRSPVKGNPGFDKFVEERVRAEMVQSGWRLRSTRRSDEQVVWYIVGDGDVSYLRDYFPDAQFEVKSAFEICPEAGAAGEQMYWKILQAFKTLTETKKKITKGGDKITTDDLASNAGCSRSYVSRIAKKFCPGGFSSFKKVLLTLLNNLYRTSNTSHEELTEEEKYAVQTYLPGLMAENLEDPATLVEEVVCTALSFGWTSFKRVLYALPPDYRTQLLGNMLALLPEEWQREFLEIGQAIAQT